MKINVNETYRINRTRSGAVVFDIEDTPGSKVLEALGQFVVECVEQRGELPELTTPEAFRPGMLRFEFTGLYGADADRPWHVLDITRF